jgi:hypothetical protein
VTEEDCDHSGERVIDRATGDEWCVECGKLNPPSWGLMKLPVIPHKSEGERPEG